MKPLISVLFLLCIPFSLAYSSEQLSIDFENKYCSINQLGNKVCSFENGCYEYWNTSGIRYRHCPEDEYHNELNQYGLTKEAIDKGVTCDDFFPGTTHNGMYCMCPDGFGWNKISKMCSPYVYEKVLPSSKKSGPSTYELFLAYGTGLVIIALIVLYFWDKKEDVIRLEAKKKQDIEASNNFKKWEKARAEKEAEKVEWYRFKPIDDRPGAIRSYDEYLKETLSGNGDTQESEDSYSDGTLRL